MVHASMDTPKTARAHALTCTAAAQSALVSVLLIALGVATVLIRSSLAAQWPLKCGVTLGTAVQADTSMQDLLDDGHVVAFGKATVGKSGRAVLCTVGAVGVPLVGACCTVCGTAWKQAHGFMETGVK